MYSPDALRDRFAEGSLQTASASKIVTMCFDRLDRELATALDAIEACDHFVCNGALGHAQDLLAEMAGMIDLDVWEHAGAVVSLYDYLLRLLTVANTQKDVASVAEAQRIVGELGDAFRVAAEQPTTGNADTDQPAPAAGDRPRLSIRA